MNRYPTSFASRNAEIGEIHRRAGLLGMDTRDKNASSKYRSMLWTVARVHSATELDWAGRRKVLDHLAGLMKAEGIQIKKPNEWAFIDHAAAARQPLLRKICAVCRSMNVGKSYAEGAARRQTGVARKLEMMDEGQLWLLAGVLERTRKSREPATK